MIKEPLVPREVDLNDFLTTGILAVFKKLLSESPSYTSVNTLISDVILYIHPHQLDRLRIEHPDLLWVNPREHLFRYKGIKVVPNNLASMPFISHLGITYDL